MKDFKIPKVNEQIIPQVENLCKSLLFIGLLINSFILVQIGVTTIDNYFLLHPQPIHQLIKWTFVMVLALFNSLILTGVGVIAHEAIHGILFKSKFWNDLYGGILSSLVAMLPFYANRKFHLTHHRYTHQPGLDPEEKSHNHPFWYAFFMGGFISIYEHYKIVFSNLLAVFSHKWIQVYQGIKDVCFISLATTLYFYVLPKVGISIWYTVIPTFLLGPIIYSFRALCDHYAFVPVLSPTSHKYLNQQTQTEDNGNNIADNLIQVDSWVVLTNPLLNWLWSHINYQQVHHRYPYLSHRYLPDIFEVTKHKQPYAVVRGYFRCLMILRKMQYYSNLEEIKPFLSIDN